MDLSSLGFKEPISAGCTGIVATVSSPEPVVLIFWTSAAKLNKRPRSDGLIGDAFTSIRTSSSPGTGFSTFAIESSIFPSLVAFDLICFENSSDITFPLFLIEFLFTKQYRLKNDNSK